MTSPRSDRDDGLWIFGYGSLIWRPDFAHCEAHPARIRGFRRVFWQGSTDHRGTPEAPGRVVTVLPEDGASCEGRAFRVESGCEQRVLDELDHREKGGYARFEVSASLGIAGGSASGTDLVSAIMYAATPLNPNYLGEASAQDIARQVCAASGPSGENADYVLELATALRAMRAEDAHVFEVEREVGRLQRAMAQGFA